MAPSALQTDGSSSDRSAGPLASLVRRNSLTSGREARRAHRHQTAAEARAMGPPPPPPPPRLADTKETDGEWSVRHGALAISKYGANSFLQRTYCHDLDNS